MKKIGILTSGGDASTMNKCLSTFVTFAKKYDCEIYFIYEGYKGLYHNEFKKADFNEAKSWWDLPGTKIFTSRFPDILKEDVKNKMVQNLKDNKIDCLVVIGGDGSYKGANLLAKSGIKVICLPGSIDNDVSSTTYSIGFDTALNVVVDSIKKIKSCMNSHGTVAIVEIMGRHCVDLTVFAGVAAEADFIITPETHYSPEELLAKIKEIRKTNYRGIVILVVEKYLGHDGLPSIDDYIKYLESNSNEAVKKNVLGYLQRGGTPSAMDLFRASLMSKEALKFIHTNQFNKIIGIDESRVVSYDLETGLNMKNPSRMKIIEDFFN